MLSAHCGSMAVLAAARGSSLLTGAVPLLLTVLTVLTRVILQRPVRIYELDMNSRNAVRARAARANGCVCRDPVLLTRQSNKTARRDFECREKRRAFRADVFRHRLLAFNNLAIFVDNLDAHIHGDGVSRGSALIRKRYQYFIRRFGGLERTVRDVVTLPRFFFITRRRMLADERDADIEHCLIFNERGLGISHDGPDPVLVFDMIEHAQLPRHRDRHVQQSTLFGGMSEGETGAERGHVREPGNLAPLESRRVAAPYPHGESERESLANSFPISLFTHGSRRT